MNNDFFTKVVDLLQSSRSQVVRLVNSTMVSTYFQIGRMIVDEQQGGKARAVYGKGLLKELSTILQREFGKGFSVDNLENMRRFYLVYGNSETVSRNSASSISETPSRKLEVDPFILSFSHYVKLMRIDDPDERRFYEIEASNNSWSLNELQRQYDSALYLRLSLSRNKEEVIELSQKGQLIQKPKDAIKDPYILEFLGLPEHSSYSENDLEQRIIDKLEQFLLELGNGFAFVARQKRITFDEKHFWIDLVFYNRILKSFVLIDLKIGELKHQNIGQMQMYVNYYDREIRLADENKTIGIILCQDKTESVVRYTLPEDNENIFASKYGTILPSKEDLKKLIGDKN